MQELQELQEPGEPAGYLADAAGQQPPAEWGRPYGQAEQRRGQLQGQRGQRQPLGAAPGAAPLPGPAPAPAGTLQGFAERDRLHMAAASMLDHLQSGAPVDLAAMNKLAAQLAAAMPGGLVGAGGGLDPLTLLELEVQPEGGTPGAQPRVTAERLQAALGAALPASPLPPRVAQLAPGGAPAGVAASQHEQAEEAALEAAGDDDVPLLDAGPDAEAVEEERSRWWAAQQAAQQAQHAAGGLGADEALEKAFTRQPPGGVGGLVLGVVPLAF